MAELSGQLSAALTSMR